MFRQTHLHLLYDISGSWPEQRQKEGTSVGLKQNYPQVLRFCLWNITSLSNTVTLLLGHFLRKCTAVKALSLLVWWYIYPVPANGELKQWIIIQPWLIPVYSMSAWGHAEVGSEPWTGMVVMTHPLQALHSLPLAAALTHPHTWSSAVLVDISLCVLKEMGGGGNPQRLRDLLPLKHCFSFHPFEGGVRRVCVWRAKASRTGYVSTDVGSKTGWL